LTDSDELAFIDGADGERIGHAPANVSTEKRGQLADKMEQKSRKRYLSIAKTVMNFAHRFVNV
jgi:hypothetical protein